MADLTEDEREAYRKLRDPALKVLGRQLRSKNENVAQRAARLILEYSDGKPTQVVEVDQGPTVIVYETAARTPAGFELPAIDGQLTDAQQRVAVLRPAQLSPARFALDVLDSDE